MADLRRAVRDDQHGTIAGYVYGCRCYDCRKASAGYRAVPHISTDVIGRVLSALEREADLDGYVTATGERLGELAGVTPKTANTAVHALAADGRVRILGHVGRGNTLEVQLADGAA